MQYAVALWGEMFVLEDESLRGMCFGRGMSMVCIGRRDEWWK